MTRKFSSIGSLVNVEEGGEAEDILREGGEDQYVLKEGREDVEEGGGVLIRLYGKLFSVPSRPSDNLCVRGSAPRF